jgi:hypothetical protein
LQRLKIDARSCKCLARANATRCSMARGSCRQRKTGTNLEHPPVAKVSLPHIAGDSIMEISEKRERGQSGQVHPKLITRTPLANSHRPSEICFGKVQRRQAPVVAAIAAARVSGAALAAGVRGVKSVVTAVERHTTPLHKGHGVRTCTRPFGGRPRHLHD